MDSGGDPVWDAINVHFSFLTQQLTTCKEKHLASETAIEDAGQYLCCVSACVHSMYRYIYTVEVYYKIKVILFVLMKQSF